MIGIRRYCNPEYGKYSKKMSCDRKIERKGSLSLSWKWMEIRKCRKFTEGEGDYQIIWECASRERGKKTKIQRLGGP